MTRSIKYIVSIGLLVCAINALAQDSLRVETVDSLQRQTKDSTDINIADLLKTMSPYSAISNKEDTLIVAISDTLKIEIADSLTMEEVDTTALPENGENYFSILIGTDYGKLITTLAQLDTRYEFNLGIQFSKSLRATVDYGYGELAPPNAIENGTYTSSGNYYRVGLDYMFTLAPKTFLSFGGMYASSAFNDEGTVEIESEIWPSLKERFTRNDFAANWAEFVLTTEAPILNKNKGFFSNLYWGIKFRLRFMIDRPVPENFDVYAIPGYGRTWNNVVPTANLFIVYKL